MLKNALYPAVGLIYVSNGMQVVLLGWLALSALDLPPMAVGFLMASMLLPQVVLLPLAGRWADRLAPADLAKAGCAGLSVCHISLVAALHLTALNSAMLAIYAFGLGLSMALFLPAKDKAAVQLLPNRLQKALSLSSAFQFSGVAIGTLLAGFVDEIGVTGVLIVQFLLSALAAVYWGLIPTQVGAVDSPAPTGGRKRKILLRLYAESLRLLRESNALRQLIGLCAFNGFMQMGFAMVLFPVLGFKHWGFTSTQYALMQALFSFGAIVVYVANAYRRPQQYPGQAALFCLLYSAGIAYAITRDPTPFGSYGLIFLWGVVAGYSASMSRVLLHSVAADTTRGRATALYQMALLACAPVGSLVCGLLLQWMGVHQVLVVLAVANVVVFLGYLLSRELWSIKQAGT
ncbi:MAG TPA: MFS transporter [Marinagarivorans sp.]